MDSRNRSAELEEIWALFAQEGRENLDLVEESLLALAQKPDDVEQIAALFRAMHSFKGAARMMGLSVVESLAHHAEDLIALVRDEGIALEAEMTNLLLAVLDRLRAMLEHVLRSGRDAEPDAAENLVADLQQMIARKQPTAIGSSASTDAESPKVLTLNYEPVEEQSQGSIPDLSAQSLEAELASPAVAAPPSQPPEDQVAPQTAQPVSLRGAVFATKQSPTRELGIASQKALAMTGVVTAPQTAPHPEIAPQTAALDQVLEGLAETIGELVADYATLHRAMSRLAETDMLEGVLRLAKEANGDWARLRRDLQGLLGKWNKGLDTLARVESEMGAAMGRLQDSVRSALPGTMAVVDGMVMRVGAVRYVVPVNAIRRIVKPSAADVVHSSAEGSQSCLRLGEELIPICALVGNGKTSDRLDLMVVVEGEQGVTALTVDELIGQQQVLVRPLQGPMAHIHDASGCALLGEGEVGIVIRTAQIHFGRDRHRNPLH